MRIVVLGGTGFVGRRTVAALRRFPGVDVRVASRRGPVFVDLARPETFEALANADVVLDLTDGTRSRPDALATWCLEKGRTLLEATSDSETVRRLVALGRASQGPGRLVLGAGLFTGVSNLMARAVTDAAGPGASLTFAVSWSPYSGAGTGTIALMAAAAARPYVHTVAGERVEEAPSRGPDVVFDGVRRPTYRASFAESELLPSSTGARDVETLFAFRPAVLVSLFAATPSWMLKAAWFRALVAFNFTILRRFLLRAVPSAVQLVAFASKDGRTARRELTCVDGMEAVAWCCAAMAEAVLVTPPPPGLSCIDDVVPLDAIVSRVNEIAGTTVLRHVPAP